MTKVNTLQGQFKSVLFDLDGTLADTSDDFVFVLNKQRQLHNLPALPAGSIRSTVSDGARALTKLAFGGSPGEQLFEARREELLALYLQEVGNNSSLFSGMDDVLQHLEKLGLSWGVVTNKPKKYADILMSKLDLDTRCSVLVCPDDVAQAKPHPEGLLLAAKTVGASTAQCLYAGDHIRDIEAGHAANMVTVAASYGYIHPNEDVKAWNAHHIIDHPLEIIALVN